MGKLTSRSVGVSPTRLHPFRSKSRVAPLLLLFGVFLAPSAFAQSAANFDTKALASEASAPKETKTAKSGTKPVAKEAGPLNAMPSRQVGPAELAPYMESLSSVLLIRGRAADPFGQLQDPDAKPVIKAPVAGAVKRAAPIQATPFADIVGMIVVTTIMPGEKRFLVGTRSIKQGDQIPLSFRGRPIRVQVTEVTSRQIDFRNLDSGETASRKLDLLPAGMTPGNNGITAPGMIPDRPNAPIELEAPDPTR